MQVREKVEKSRNTDCVSRMFCGSGGSKSRLARAAGAEPSGKMRDEKLHAVVARSTSPSQNVKSTLRWALQLQLQLQLHYTTPHYTTPHHTTLHPHLHLQLQLQLFLHYTTLGFNYTTLQLQLQLHYTTPDYNCSTPHYKYNYNYNYTRLQLQYTTLHDTSLDYSALQLQPQLLEQLHCTRDR